MFWKRHAYFYVQDEKILLEDGSYSAIEYIYPTKGNLDVYNLILEGDDRIVFANGIAAGDNKAQNKSYERIAKDMAIDEDIIKEAERLQKYHEEMNS